MDRIKTHILTTAAENNELPIENLENVLQDMCHKGT